MTATIRELPCGNCLQATLHAPAPQRVYGPNAWSCSRCGYTQTFATASGNNNRAEHSAHAQEAEQEAAEDPFLIAVYSARDLCALPLEHDNHDLIGPYIRRGRITLLGGATGHGKTTFGTQALAAGVLGREFLGHEVKSGLRILVLDLEQHLEDIQEQLRAVGLADSDLLDYAPIPEGLMVDKRDDHAAELVRVITAKPYDVVRIDPHYKLHAGDSSEETAARDLVRLARRLVNQHGFGLLVDTHVRKTVDGHAAFTIDDLFGSSLFTRDPEIVLGLRRVSDGFARLHVFKARGRRGDLRTGQVIDLLYNDVDLFTLKPEEREIDVKAALLDLGADQVWRTVKEWKAKPGDPDADRGADNYVDLRGGVGVGEAKVKATLLELQSEGVFEYGEGAAVGRSANAKCWRLGTALEAQGSPGQSPPGTYLEAPTALLPRPYIEAVGRAVGADVPDGLPYCPGAVGADEDEIERLAEAARRAQEHDNEEDT